MNGNSPGSFLGTGWAFPPSFSQNGQDVAMASDQEDIQQCLLILLNTTYGERIMREDFGCGLEVFMFEEISQSLVNQITRLISDAVLYYEPRIKLNAVNVDESEQEVGMLLIHLDYTVKSNNSRFNMVYPFYLYEGNTGNV